MRAAASLASPPLPRALRAGYALWFGVWLVLYLGYFGWSTLLWFCCLANIYVLIGCATQRALWFSLAAVSTLAVQSTYAVDFVVACIAHTSPTGATSYMFDPTRPLPIRVFSLFHVWMPLLLLYALSRLGYDRRAFWIQTAVALCILPICYYGFDPSQLTNDAVMPHVRGLPFDRDFNINWVHAFYDRPAPGLERRRFWTVLLGYPLAVHLPTHLLLSLRPWSRVRTAET